jgi:hypothetical protein
MAKTNRVVWRPDHSRLEVEILRKIDGILSGKVSGKDAGAWAVKKYSRPNSALKSESLAGTALRALMVYQFGMEPGMSTLTKLKAALQGELEYVVTKTEYDREDIERKSPGVLLSEDELIRQWPPYATYLEQAR